MNYTAPGVTFEWWDGSTLIPLTLDGVWNGSTVDPVDTLSISGVVTPPPAGDTSLAYLADPANFGVPVGTSLTSVAWNTVANVSNTTYTAKLFTDAAVDIGLDGSGNTFINCAFTGKDITVRGNNNTFTRCEAAKFSFSSASGIRGTDNKSVPVPGWDAFTVTSDRSPGVPMCSDIIWDGFHVVGDASTMVQGSGNHYDCIQIRGVQGFTLRRCYLDQGPVFVGSPFNATIFFENANGGNDNCLVEYVYSRAASYYHLYLFATNLTLRNMTFARIPGPPSTNVLYGATPGFTQSAITWDDGTPFTIQ